MTAVIAAAGPDTPPGGVAYHYEPQHTRPTAVCLCYCGARAAGRTHYYRGHQLIGLKDQCPEHLPTTAAAYTIVDTPAWNAAA